MQGERRAFSVFKRVKNDLRSTLRKQTLNNLSLLYMGNDSLNKLLNYEDFQ